MHEETPPPAPDMPNDLSAGVVWLRPEYRDRADELVTLSEGADLVGVTRSAVSNWAARHQNFPPLVLLAGAPGKRTKYVVRAELIEFARIQLNRPVGPRGGGDNRPHRPSTQIAADSAAHYEALVTKLAEREQRQAAALDRTRAARRAAEAKLAQARARLAAEVDAVARIRATPWRSRTTGTS
ncbi:hypothetical protein [Streptomyces sp. NPDC047315]|uniref:hypothetical protein n=1 Tax=Streptomyces sp. NPDC047315 TaxID=3155142 RepID=UPI0033F92E5B